jgi:PPOX class probable F420-dependent enzyme
MAALSDEVRRAITAGHLGHLVTLNPDGSPQVSLVWIGLEEDDVVIGHLGSGQKISNLEEDPRVVLSVECDEVNPMGLQSYLVIHGTARLEAGGAPELLQRLAETYLGPGIPFPPMPSPPPGHVIRVTAERVGGVGPWAAS